LIIDNEEEEEEEKRWKPESKNHKFSSAALYKRKIKNEL
jgi:hypothetical protein